MKDLKLSLIVEALDRATAPLRKIGGVIEGLEHKIHAFNARLGKFGLEEAIGIAAVTAGAIEAAKGLFELTNKTAEYGEAALLGAKRAGVTVEAFQKVRFAANQLGMDGDALASTFFRLENHLANGIRGNKITVAALGMIGIKAKELKTLSKDPLAALARFQDGFERIINPTQRAFVAMQLFGRGGAEMLPFLTAGRAKVAEFEKQLEDAHGVMTNEDAEASEEFIQKKKLMGVALEALQRQIGIRLIPTMTMAIDKVTAWVEALSPKALDTFTKAVNSLVAKLPNMATGLANIAQIAFGVAGWLLTMASDARVLNGALIALALVMTLQFVAALVEGLAAIKTVVVWLRIMKLAIVGAWLARAAQAIYLFVAGVWALAPALGAATAAMTSLDIAMAANPVGIIALAIGLVIAAVAALAFGVYLVITHWKQIAPFFVGLWAGVLNTLKSVWGGVTSFFSNLMSGIENIFANAWKRISVGMPSWLQSLIKAGAIGVAVTAPGIGIPLAAAIASTPRVGAPRAISAPGAAGGDHRVQVGITLDQNGQMRAKSVKASPGVTATVNRGHVPG